MHETPELKNFNLSDAGRKWLLKALHPANPKIGRVAVPSGTTTSSTTAEIIKEYTVVAPSFFPGVSWDCLIVQPPSDTVAAVIFVKPSSRRAMDVFGQFRRQLLAAWYGRWQRGSRNRHVHRRQLDSVPWRHLHRASFLQCLARWNRNSCRSESG